jgi:hypothetical protein
MLDNMMNKMAHAMEQALVQHQVEQELGYCVEARDVQRLLADMAQGG